MQTCSQCHTQASDETILCPGCGSSLAETSEQSVALKKYQDNPRVQVIRVAVSTDCCPACRSLEGTYKKEEAPSLPVKGCSHENGCRCFYEPILSEIFP